MANLNQTEIEQIILRGVTKGAVNGLELAEKLLAPDFKLFVVGQGLGLSSEGLDFGGVKEKIVDPVMNALDTTKPTKTEVVRVIASGGSWFAVEVKSTGTFKNSNPWKHEYILLGRIGEDNLVHEAKAFLDTLQLKTNM